MRRALLVLVAGLAFTSYIPAQIQEPSPATPSEAKQETGQANAWIWEWLNFAILVGVLGYMARKYAPPLFQARSQEIHQALADAANAKKDAEARAGAIELRLKSLKSEVDKLREEARAEMNAEGERIRRETERHLARIQEQTVQEIGLMTRAARDELRRYSADLAVGLAQQRLQARITPEVEQYLVDGFLDDLRSRMPVAARI